MDDDEPRGLRAGDLIDAHEVATILGVSVYTVGQWAREGRIPSYRLGRYRRFTRAMVEEWLERQLEGGPPS